MPITLKRKPAEADTTPAPRSTAIPSTLPPSVEEAYRRKCVQLKNRTNEVEDANDAARLRLARIKRQVEKLRIERAFLLEQLAKRTSTNVEDSEGSPSPPPTIDHFTIADEPAANPRKPKEKPLRTKRGHRKSALPDADSKAGATSFNTNQPGSPGSETFSQPPEASSKGARANGISKSKLPADAYELYCDETRPILEAKHKDSEGDIEADFNVDDELSKKWKELSEAEQDEFQTKLEQQQAKAKASESKETPAPEEEEEDDKKEEKSDDKDKNDADDKNDSTDKPEESRPATQDEDVEMGEDTEDQDTQAGEKMED